MRRVIYNLLWLTLGVGLLVIVDQWCKERLGFLETAPVDFGWGRLIWHANPGISFGIELPGTIAVMLIVIFLLFLIWLWFTGQRLSLLSRIGLTMSISGGTSNLIDRLLFGHVRDFVAIPFLPIFNLADILVVAGVLLILWGFYRRERT